MDEDEDQEPLVPIQLRLSPTQIARIDRYRRGMTLRPTRAWTIRFLLENALNILESGEHPRGE